MMPRPLVVDDREYGCGCKAGIGKIQRCAIHEAAHDLLDALTALVGKIEWDEPITKRDLAQASAAIRKATGE